MIFFMLRLSTTVFPITVSTWLEIQPEEPGEMYDPLTPDARSYQI